MKTYELTYIVSPEITSEEAGAAAKEIESFIQSKEGAVLRQINPTAKTLSYPIKKHASGFVGVLEFQAEPETLVELKEKIEKDGKVVRHMVIIKKPIKEHKKRGSRIKPAPIDIPPSFAKASAPAKASADKSEGKEKIQLKDIEQKLEEILGE